MRAVVTRVNEASVSISGETVGKIGKGFLILLGIAPGDTDAICEKLADKICALRVFEDENGKMNMDLASVDGQLLIVSQFTLYADFHGRRPGFSAAAKPDTAIPLYEKFMKRCRDNGFAVQHGQFGADMLVASVNDGPVTLVIDTDNL